MRPAVGGHGRGRGGRQHPDLAAVVHPRHLGGRADTADRLLAQLDLDRAALLVGALAQRQDVLDDGRRVGGEGGTGGGEGEPDVRPVLAGALPDHRLRLQPQAAAVQGRAVGRAPERAGHQVGDGQCGRAGLRRLDGELQVGGQLGRVLLGLVQGDQGL